MTKILQEYTFDEDQIINAVHASYHIGSLDKIDTSVITNSLGLQPSKCWSKGDKFLTKSLNTATRQLEEVWRVRAVSVWRVDTLTQVDSKYAKEHLLFLVNNLERSKNWISHHLLSNDNYQVSFQLTIEMAREVVSFSLPSNLLSRASRLSKVIEFSIISPEEL